MALHRRVAVGLPVPEPDWPGTQADPALTDVVKLVRLDGPGTLIWWAIPMDGNDETSSPVDGTGFTYDAQVVIREPVVGGRGTSYTGYTPIATAFGGPFPTGFVAIERDLPPGATGYIRMIAINAAGPATHVWLNYKFIPKGAVGL